MKTYHNLIMVCLISSLGLLSCKKDFLDKKPLGTASEADLTTAAGIKGLLIGAYSMLDGVGGPSPDGNPFSQGVSNWVFGGVASDDAHKGSTDDDQTDAATIENYTVNSTNLYVDGKWVALYTGIQRANDVLRTLAKVPAGAITEAQTKDLKAQAIFLRAVFHLEAAKLWRNIPYVDETISYESGNYNVHNTEPVWPKIEGDLTFAVANLNSTQPDKGMANSWAAKAFLAKAYMFQQKFSDARPLLEDIIANGVTASGLKYALVTNYQDNFNAATKNNSESVFAVQMSVKDGSSGSNNGNIGDILNFPYGGPNSCCGFYQPSFSLVNSFKTDPATGLPLLDTWNDGDLKNDQGLSSADPFTPSTATVDPRLDHSVGRRGIPYLDWGVMPGQSWVRSQVQAGPYLPKKNVVYKSQVGNYSDVAQGWGVNQATAINYVMIRFADVLLWAAEAEIEIGSLDKAQGYVNQVRNRAANPASLVYTYVDNDPSKGFSTTPAANYKVEPYPAGTFLTRGQDYARKAVRFERKLEFAMEGHRFFDLQRYDNGTGYMADVLNAYIQHETSIPGYDYEILKGAKFTKGKNELYPIPLDQIDLSAENGTATLKQNPGYN